MVLPHGCVDMQDTPKDEWLETTDYLNFEFFELDQQRAEVTLYLKEKLKALIKRQLDLVEHDLERSVQYQLLIASADKDMGTVHTLTDLLLTLHSLDK